MNDVLDSSAVRLLTRNDAAKVTQSSNAASGDLTLSNGSGLTAYVSYDLATEQGIQYSWLSIELGGNTFVAVPQAQASQLVRDIDGSTTLHLVATDLLIGDTKGDFDFIASDDSAVSSGALSIEIEINSVGTVISSAISLTPRA
jgi:hypothetical protein